MRKYMVLVALSAALVSASGVSAQVTPPPVTTSAPAAAFKLPAGATIAYINSERVISEAPGAKEAQTTIQREMEKYRAELALLEDSIQNMAADYQQKSVMLSPDAKKKQEDAIRAKNTALQSRTQQYDQNMQKRQQELVQPIMDRINKVLQDMRKEYNLAIILDSRAGSIVQADTTLDMTGEVLRRLRASAPAAKKPGS